MRAIRYAVEAANGVAVDWVDDGAVIYNEQGRGLEAVQAYAKWLECRDRLPTFDAPPERNYYKHPVWDIELPSRFPHLVEHSCYSGYHVPCDFEKVVPIVYWG